jgi:signal transduction histidine kinase
MIIGISIPALITVAGSVMSYEYINDVKIRQQFVQIADDLKERVLEIRRNEKNFFIHKDAQYYNYFQRSVSVLRNSLADISPDISAEIGEGNITQLRSSIQDYAAITDELYGQYHQETGYIEKVREKGRKLEAYAAAKEGKEEHLVNFILNLRRFEKNYMLFRDRNSFYILDRALTETKSLLPSCVECAAYTETIYNLSNSYKKSALLINELQIIGDTFEKITYRNAGLERQKINAFLDRTHNLLFMVLILFCTIGPFLVYKTSSYIVAPINRLADITKRIAAGDLNLRAPFKEHDETYTLAQSFNIMLDQLQLTQESLERSLELLHEKHIEAEKRASLGFLISGVTHELNNPLNNISLTAETMKEDLEELTHEELQECIQDILTQSERAKHIIDDLLDFGGRRKSTAMEKLDIINVLEESVNLVANEMRVSNINLKMNLSCNAFLIRGNRVKLEEVFVNLFINAIQAMKNNGTLTITATPDAENRAIIIAVNDTGKGIPKEDIRNIFEPFFTTKEVGEGTGLGLSVTHGIINDHKGELSVESQEGVGTTFTIKLPCYEDAV